MYLQWSNLQRQILEWWLPEAELGGGKNRELLLTVYRISVCQDKKILELDDTDDCTTM